MHCNKVHDEETRGEKLIHDLRTLIHNKSLFDEIGMENAQKLKDKLSILEKKYKDNCYINHEDKMKSMRPILGFMTNVLENNKSWSNYWSAALTTDTESSHAKIENIIKECDPPKTNTLSSLIKDSASGKIKKDNIKNYLIDKSTIHEKDSNGMTALMHAAAGGHLATMSLLMDHGAKAGEKDIDGMTALMHAAAKGKTNTMDILLITEKDQVNQQDDYGNTAMMHAAANGKTEAIVRLRPWADINKPNKQGVTPLKRAANNNDGGKTMKRLLIEGANIHKSSKEIAKTNYGEDSAITKFVILLDEQQDKETTILCNLQNIANNQDLDSKIGHEDSQALRTKVNKMIESYDSITSSRQEKVQMLHNQLEDLQKWTDDKTGNVWTYINETINSALNTIKDSLKSCIPSLNNHDIDINTEAQQKLQQISKEIADGLKHTSHIVPQKPYAKRLAPSRNKGNEARGR
ncbi:MAG: ankyrin repeat domain-containing protein [Rickettsiaceae bacterium]|nr:ankyrin repeat domain-containing protein [Rickettsiaceae bacterium]